MNIKQRNLVTSIILSVVTCGIYGIYWCYCVAKESLTVYDPEYKGTLEIILMIFLPFVGAFMVEKKFAEGMAAKGIEHKDNSVLYLILGLIPFGWLVDLALMQTELNKIAEA